MAGIVNTTYMDITVGTRIVRALVVGNTGLNEGDGVFALSLSRYPIKSPKNDAQILCTFFVGDDRRWKEIATFDFHFIVQIAQCLLIALDMKEIILTEKRK